MLETLGDASASAHASRRGLKRFLGREITLALALAAPLAGLLRAFPEQGESVRGDDGATRRCKSVHVSRLDIPATRGARIAKQDTLFGHGGIVEGACGPVRAACKDLVEARVPSEGRHRHLGAHGLSHGGSCRFTSAAGDNAALAFVSFGSTLCARSCEHQVSARAPHACGVGVHGGQARPVRHGLGTSRTATAQDGRCRRFEHAQIPDLEALVPSTSTGCHQVASTAGG
mmetsp:Transcript_30321/g.81529  ORF Transcript_30321/g.81529 Transcript_30321/m.81529 type:complete len:230 (-) Transcript_30321:1048-1737(-)